MSFWINCFSHLQTCDLIFSNKQTFKFSKLFKPFKNLEFTITKNYNLCKITYRYMLIIFIILTYAISNSVQLFQKMLNTENNVLQELNAFVFYHSREIFVVLEWLCQLLCIIKNFNGKQVSLELLFCNAATMEFSCNNALPSCIMHNVVLQYSMYAEISVSCS